MPKSDQQALLLLAEGEWLREFVLTAEGHPLLSSWEAYFVRDIRTIWVAGVIRKRVSKKQAQVIRQIWEKVQIEPRDAYEDALIGTVDETQDLDEFEDQDL